jgi:hypothetical protein
MAGETGLDDKYFSDITETAPPVADTTVDTTVVDDKTTEPDPKVVADDKSQQQQQQKAPVVKDDKQPKLGDKSQQQQQQKPAIKKGTRGDFMNDKGDITDESGNVLYTAGRARRAYEDNTRLREERAELLPRLQQAELQVREMNFLNGVPTRYGLANEEVATALDWAARMKRDPLSVAKDLLAMIAAQGHNVTDLLGKDVGDSIDMKAITTLLDRRLGPIEQQRNQSSEDAERLENAKRQYRAFLTENEYADVHEDAIANLARKEQLSPQIAYNRLYKFAVDNGLDFSMPLGPQIVAKREAASADPKKQQQQQLARPLPSNGAQTRTDGAKQQAPVMADPDEDWGSIISRAMQQQT